MLFCLQLHADHHVLGIGSYVWDYIQPVDDEFLDALYMEKKGHLDLDWHSFCDVLSLAESYPKPMMITGGSIANTIKGLAALGIDCALTGKAGRDKTGDLLLEALSNAGITPFATRTNTPTSQIISLVTPDGERSFCTFVQSSYEIEESDLLPKYFQNQDLVYIEGYLIPNSCVVEKAARLGKEYGALVAYDIGSKDLGERYRERLWGLLRDYIDILFVDSDESYSLTHLPPAESARLLGDLCKVAVVKVGEEGCYVCSNGKVFHKPAIPTKVVDATGAGDLFAAGFLYSYLEDAALEKCALFGNLMGSAAVERFGGEVPKERLGEIVATLK